MIEIQNEMIEPAVRFKKSVTAIYRNLLDVLFWITVLIYTSGGVWYQGSLRLTYMGDLWNACAIGYFLGRIFLGLRFSNTSFGKACLDLMKRICRGFFERDRSAWRLTSPQTLFLAFVVIYTLFLFFYLPLLHLWNGGSGVWDMGVFDNVVFNASRTGKMSTYLIFSNGVKPLIFVPGQHLDLGMYIFALIYRWIPRAEVMLIAQSLALILAVIPLYRLGKLVLPKEIPSWFPVILYLLWDPIYRMNLWDVHEPPFLMLFAFWAFYFIEQRRIGLALLNMFLMAIWREDAWWTFAGMSLWLGYRTRSWRVGLPGFIVGFVLFPAHIATLNHVNKLTDRYPFLADTLSNSIKLIAHRPSVLFHAFMESRNFFLELLLRSGGGVFLLGGVVTICGIPTILESGLSPAMSLWYNHYIGSFTAPVMVATLYGWKRLDEVLKRNFPGKSLTGLLAMLSLALCLTQIKTSLPGMFSQLWAGRGVQTCLDQVSAVVPPEAPVLVADNSESRVLTRLNHRAWIMTPQLELDQTRAEWLVSNDKEDLRAGLKGIKQVEPWKIVWEGCGLFVANRAK